MAVTIDAATAYQTIDGFGVDLACIPAPGITDAQADSFFSLSAGIGLTWARLRASVVDGSIPGWLLSGGNDNRGQVATAQKARDRGARFWALADSNTIPAEWKDGRTLLPDRYSDFAAGTAAIVAQGAALGLNVEIISVCNEPEIAIEPDINGTVAHDLVALIGPQLTGGVKLMLPEPAFADNLATFADATLNDAATRAYIGKVGTHVYNSNPITPYALAATHGIPVWQTEYNDSYTGAATDLQSAIRVAKRTHQCLADGNYSMSGFFLVAGLPDFEGQRFGLLGNAFAPTKRFHSFGNYSKFVRPGHQRIACSGAPGGTYISAYKAAGQVVIVAINENSGATAISVTGAGGFASAVPWITDATRDLAAQSAVAVTAGAFGFSLPALSVTTFVVSDAGAGVTVVPPTASLALAAYAPVVSVFTPSDSALRLADGSPLPLQAWDGSQWVDVPLLVFNGSVFV
jgi:glucuronoarabinoxylan endo-1,4-beta-xylanase